MSRAFLIGALIFAASAAGILTFRDHLMSETRSGEQQQTTTKLKVAEMEPLKADFAAVMPKPVPTVKFVRPPPPPASVAEAVANQQEELPPEHNGYVGGHDVCAKYGGHRVDFRRGRHLMWRCVYPGKRR